MFNIIYLVISIRKACSVDNHKSILKTPQHIIKLLVKCYIYCSTFRANMHFAFEFQFLTNVSSLDHFRLLSENQIIDNNCRMVYTFDIHVTDFLQKFYLKTPYTSALHRSSLKLLLVKW